MVPNIIWPLRMKNRTLVRCFYIFNSKYNVSFKTFSDRISFTIDYGIDDQFFCTSTGVYYNY